MGQPNAQSDGNAESRTGHAVIGVLVRARPSAAGAMGWKEVTRSYTFKGRDVCVLSGPRTDAAVRSLADPANDLLHVRLPCHERGHWAVQLRECHEDRLHLPHTGVGPTELAHVWFTGLQAVF